MAARNQPPPLRALNKDLGGVRGNPSFAEVAAKAATLAPVLNR